MQRNHFIKLHWKLFFPIVGIIWLIIGINIIYSVNHDKHRQMENLENRLLNVNNTVLDAYDRGVDLQKTVNFIRLFTGETTLEPLRLTIYNDSGKMIADNPGTTILLHDKDGNPIPELKMLMKNNGNTSVRNMVMDNTVCMVSAMKSKDGHLYSFAALPYEGEVLAFLKVDPMVWIVILILGIISSVLAYLGLKAICHDVYSLRDFANDIASDRIPDIDSRHFSNDELGDVSRNLMTLYRNKLHAEQEKTLHERLISQNLSHELRTPVGIIKGYLDTLIGNDDIPEEQRKHFLLRAQQNADRLSDLINYIGEITRIDQNHSSSGFTTFNFHETVERLADDIAAGKIAGDMEFIYDIPDHCMVTGNETLLSNALLNLVNNAEKYSGGTRMELRLIKTENGLHYFSFADNGRGVSNQHLSQLFDLFYRVDSGRSRKNGGSGLGLPIVKRIFTTLGGDISVSNATSGGLEFIFSIPAGE